MYINRELSWLKFNERVLEEGNEQSLPLLERLNFLAIFANNLDEFFMVRVSSIMEQITAEYSKDDNSGLTPTEVYKAIRKHVNELYTRQHRYLKICLRGLENEGVTIVSRKDFDEAIKGKINKYFNNELFPVLTPMAVDFSRPFPFVRNKMLYIIAKIKVGDVFHSALIQVPSNMQRCLPIKVNHITKYVLLEDVIIENIDRLFIGYEVVDTSLFRITRDADLVIKEEAASDLLVVIEAAVKKRQWGAALRLEVSHQVDDWILNELKKIFVLKDDQVFRMKGIMDQTLWFDFMPKGFEHLMRQQYVSEKLPLMNQKNLFKSISEGDVFAHHPYESFDVVVDFIKQASKDPKVLAIKQTLYRVSGDSAIVKALGDAAEAGKQVTVLVELMARFDEENNIGWAKKLEKQGVHVIYGVYNIKTHSKITLVVRKENKRIKRYVHIGTGNYNDKTAKLYTDMSYFTCRETIGADASIFFNMVFGFTSVDHAKYLVVSPDHLRTRLNELIQNEIDAAKQGKEACIIAKMNALVDKAIIDQLYEASQAGVKIQLIVRGICSLVPGIKGLSDHITVKSIIGEFLEHARVYYFKHDEKQLYLSSADWMTRNLNRRVEVMMPVLDQNIKKRIQMILYLDLADNKKSWRLDSKGDYHKLEVDGKTIHEHEILKVLDYDSHEAYIERLNEKIY